MRERRINTRGYVEKKGVRCPDDNCGSVNIEGGPVEIDASVAIQECVCSDCGLQWSDVYRLVGCECDHGGAVDDDRLFDTDDKVMALYDELHAGLDKAMELLDKARMMSLKMARERFIG